MLEDKYERYATPCSSPSVMQVSNHDMTTLILSKRT